MNILIDKKNDYIPFKLSWGLGWGRGDSTMRNDMICGRTDSLANRYNECHLNMKLYTQLCRVYSYKYRKLILESKKITYILIIWSHTHILNFKSINPLGAGITATCLDRGTRWLQYATHWLVSRGIKITKKNNNNNANFIELANCVLNECWSLLQYLWDNKYIYYLGYFHNLRRKEFVLIFYTSVFFLQRVI